MFSVTTLLVLMEILSSFTSSNALTPGFSSSTSQKVDAVLGEDLLLHCQVEHFGHPTASLTRQIDLQILTIGNHKCTTNNRISVKHNPHNGDFILVFKQASEDVLWVYECDRSTLGLSRSVW